MRSRIHRLAKCGSRAIKWLLISSFNKIGLNVDALRIFGFSHEDYSHLLGYSSRYDTVNNIVSSVCDSLPTSTDLVTTRFYENNATVARKTEASDAPTVAIFRESLNEANIVCDFTVNLKKNSGISVRLFFSKKSDLDEIGLGKNQCTLISSPEEMVRVISNDHSIPDEEWIIFNITDAGQLPAMVSYANHYKNSSAAIILFENEDSFYQDLKMRRPEKLLNFAIRQRCIRQTVGNPASSASPFDSLAHAVLSGEECVVSTAARSVISSRWRRKLSVADEKQSSPFFDRLALRVLVDVLVRARPALCSHLLMNIPYHRGMIQIADEEENAEAKYDEVIPGQSSFDVIFVTDFRIRGGGVNSMLSEISIARRSGLRVGVMHLEAVSYKKKSWGFKQNIISCLAKNGVKIVNGLRSLSAELVVLRYPPILIDLPKIIPKINTKRAVVVVNQPARRLQGDVPFYQAMQCHVNGRRLLGVEPEWAPNGPEARIAMEEEARTLPFSSEDWLNVTEKFALDDQINLRVARMKDGNYLPRLGRHVRDVRNKWPSQVEVLQQCYPDSPEMNIQFLGGCKVGSKILGYRPAGWTGIPYGGMDVGKFLLETDIFVFFPHEERIEPMARCIVEALAAGLPVIIPTRFRGFYGESPIYCEPEDVCENVVRLKKDNKLFGRKCFEGRDEASRLFGPGAYVKRLSKYGVSSGLVSHG